MNFTPKPIALAVFVATTQLAGVTHAQAPKAPAAPVVQNAAAPAPAATKSPIPTKTAGRLDHLRRHHVYTGGR